MMFSSGKTMPCQAGYRQKDIRNSRITNGRYMVRNVKTKLIGSLSVRHKKIRLSATCGAKSLLADSASHAQL